jgi:hypothetical protein
MRSRARIWLLGMVAFAVVGLSAPVAQGAFGVERFVAANCSEGHESCVEEAIGPFSLPKEPSLAEAKEGGYTQAAGHPAFGITSFKINTVGTIPNAAPSGVVTHVRTDVAPGVSTNPEAVGKCSFAEYGVEALPGSGLFTEPKCSAASEIGENKVIVYIGSAPSPLGGDLPLTGKVYNLVQPAGLASDFGVALPLPKPLTEAELNNIFHGTQPEIEKAQYWAHTLIEGSVEWAGDYHDYYEINVSPAIPLIASRLLLFGNIGTTGNGGFITNPSTCPGPGPSTTNTVTIKPSAGPEVARTYTTPIGTEGCNGAAPFASVPFAPEFKLSAETATSDQPDGITTEVIVPHDPSPTGIDTSQLKQGTFILPEGMTLNPSGASGLKTCTAAQIGIKTRNPVSCPPESKIGTVTLTVPDLPASEPLEGSVYLGGDEPITKSPYTMYLNAESSRYGISVRLQGTVTTDEATGRLTTTFSENPEQPFSNLKLTFNGGPKAPIANPLGGCGTAKAETSLIPYTGTEAASPFSVFAINGNASASCPLPPFTLGQSTASSPTTGGANTSFTLNLGRADGQQYLSKVSTTLPAGLVGKIPAVPLCPEPQASLGTCSSTSQIGTATATVGSGASPVQFTGPVFLTGPTGSAPYGMTTVINAAVGPFSLGSDVVRTGIEVDPLTARVTVAGTVPTIFKGIPLRMKGLTVAITTPGFLINPTNCGVLSTNTTLTSSLGATQTLSTPFQATNCSALAFKPKFSASSNAKTSRANGAALNAKVGYPSGVQSNIKSLQVTVPKQLPSRLTTLNKACREAVFNQSPYLCPTASRVGGATVTTPVLPGKMTGPAYFVSHGGAKFPDLDFVLTGNGITVILVGNTNIQKGVTTTNFASLPDVPVSSFEENLPVGKNSAVTANGSLCKKTLIMPTTITAQNGKVIKQNTKISVSGCPVTIVSRRVSGNNAIVTVRVPAAGRLSGSGSHLKTVYRHPGKGENVTLSIPLTSGTRPLAVSVRIGFIPKKGSSSVARAGLLFP